MIQYMHNTKQCTIMILCRVMSCADPEYSATLRAGDPLKPKAQMRHQYGNGSASGIRLFVKMFE